MSSPPFRARDCAEGQIKNLKRSLDSASRLPVDKDIFDPAEEALGRLSGAAPGFGRLPTGIRIRIRVQSQVRPHLQVPAVSRTPLQCQIAVDPEEPPTNVVAALSGLHMLKQRRIDFLDHLLAIVNLIPKLDR
jgi:hypothetical protein